MTFDREKFIEELAERQIIFGNAVDGQLDDVLLAIEAAMSPDGPQHDELTPRGRLVAELHTFGVRDPDLDRIADIATTARDGAAGDWPCSFHVEPTPGCEMCRNVGGSGQRLEMSRGGAEHG